MTATAEGGPAAGVTATPQVVLDPEPTQEPELDLSSSGWVRLYSAPQDNLGSDVIQASDGELYIVGGIGEIFDDERGGGVLLIKTDESGRLLWEKVYGGEEFDIGWSILQTGDGNLVIAGQTNSYGAGGMDAYLIKVNRQGEELWSNTYGSPLDEAVSTVLESPDGSLILIGNQVDPNDFITDPGKAGYGGFGGRSNIYLVRTDADGNEIWSRTIESEDNVIASSGVTTQDGNLVILGSVLYFPDFDNDAILIKIDQDGNDLWTRSWEEDAYAGYTIAGTRDGGLLFSGILETGENPVADLYLLMVDPDGKELWRKQYGEPAIYESGHAILETDDGDIVLLVSTTESLYSGMSGILLVKADGSGTILWEQSIDHFYSSKANAVLQHRDGGYLITGSASGRDGAPSTFLLKTDREGKVPEHVEMVPFP